ncbi:hypothetical protein pEaSNUABM37_00103 [Erwinia phage pEa_SNUABM_37]|nr:hypothetical protein pEaSNUABM37_00103 [Erwinia phage pEa_SNUABM_37]QXO10573.1 hypothetical protein pEaSNUABM48_00103 [Erwinia phage pEa_SNUABM_48]
MSGKDLSSYLQEPAKPASDDLDMGALASMDFSAVEERVEQMQEGGGEVVEADNDCVDGCKI